MGDWDAWIGREERRDDRIDAGLVTRWLATLDRHGANHGLAWAADAIGRDASGRLTVADPVVRQQILDLRDISLDTGASVRDDDGLHLVAYVGDASGNAKYSTLDVQRIQRGQRDIELFDQPRSLGHMRRRPILHELLGRSSWPRSSRLLGWPCLRRRALSAVTRSSRLLGWPCLRRRVLSAVTRSSAA